MIGLSKDDLQAELRVKLETAVRERLATEAAKAGAVKSFNDDLKAIDRRIEELVAELDGCVQQRLPLGEAEE